MALNDSHRVSLLPNHYPKRWTSVVEIGRRLNQLTLHEPSAAEAAYPLMLHAQMALVKIARRKLGAIDARMAEHELKVEEAAVKRRNKYKHKVSGHVEVNI